MYIYIYHAVYIKSYIINIRYTYILCHNRGTSCWEKRNGAPVDYGGSSPGIQRENPWKNPWQDGKLGAVT